MDTKSESVSTISARRSALAGSSSTTAIMSPGPFWIFGSRRIWGQTSLEDVVLVGRRNIDRRVVGGNHRQVEAREPAFGAHIRDLLGGSQRPRGGDQARAGGGGRLPGVRLRPGSRPDS